MIDFYKAGGILLKDRKFLVVRQKDKDFYIAPGGKLLPNESPTAALIRELKEELCIDIVENDLEIFGSFTAPAIGIENKNVQMDVFFVKKWQGDFKINPDDKVEEFRWSDSIFAHDVLPKLKEKNLIN